MLSPVPNLKRVALNLLFPQWRIGCGRKDNYICSACFRTLKVIIPPICPRCGRPRFDEPDSTTCPDCINRPSVIGGIRAPFLFDGVIRDAIHEFKYRNLRALDPLLAGLMYNYLQENPIPGDCLVSVPIHRKRLRERGYNQITLLAQELGRFSDLPVVVNFLVRQKYVPPQARSSDINERCKNFSDAFACLDGRFLKCKNVILIDDLSTSGATLSACTIALNDAKASDVQGLVIALEL